MHGSPAPTGTSPCPPTPAPSTLIMCSWPATATRRFPFSRIQLPRSRRFSARFPTTQYRRAAYGHLAPPEAKADVGGMELSRSTVTRFAGHGDVRPDDAPRPGDGRAILGHAQPRRSHRPDQGDRAHDPSPPARSSEPPESRPRHDTTRSARDRTDSLRWRLLGAMDSTKMA